MSDEERAFVKSELSKIKTPYKDKIIRLLSDRLDMLPSDFTRELGIPQEDLDDVIQSMNATQVKVVTVVDLGKVKVYSLSPAVTQCLQAERRKV